MFIYRIFQIITYYSFYPILKFIFRLEIFTSKNLTNFNISEKLIIASNHCHFLDPIIAGWVFTKYFRSLKYSFSKILPIRFISASEYFNFIKSPPFFPISLIVASFVRLNGSIPILRGSNDDLEKKLKTPIEILNNNGKILIFPEGKITKDGQLQKGKRGIGYLHKVTKAAIIPIALINVYQCTNIKNLLLFLTGKKRIKVYIGDPIVDISHLEIEEITSVIMKKIGNLIESDQQNILISSIDPLHKFETHNFIIKTIRLFVLPIINNLPGVFLKHILRKTSKDSEPVLKKGDSAHALEVLYSFHERKRNIFQHGFFNGFFTVFWHIILSQPKAVRNRLKIVEAILVRKIRDIIQEKNTLKILSIAGGSSRGIIQALNHLSKKENFNFTNREIYFVNLDKNTEVLDLTFLNLQKHDLNFVKFIPLIGNAKKIEELKINDKFDIIEIVGLFDYFNNEEMVKLLNYTFTNLLNKNGSLIWGNIRPNNEMKFLQKINWPNMFYRNYYQIIQILNNSGISQNNAKILIYEEPLKIHYIIECEKYEIA